MALPSPSENNNDASMEDDIATTKYRCLVLDSGPIIKQQLTHALQNSATTFYTVPAVVAEIRDAKARQYLQSCMIDLQVREPSPASLQAVTEFARLTGDYQSLSRVDMSVLALVYELEQEGCHGDVSHIRTTPKRTCGVGKVELLNSKKENDKKEANEEKLEKEEQPEDEEEEQPEDDDDEEEAGVSSEDAEKVAPSTEENSNPAEDGVTSDPQQQPAAPTATAAPKSWAALVAPPSSAEPKIADDSILDVPFGKMNLLQQQRHDSFDESVEGNQNNNTPAEEAATEEPNVDEELQKDFPSLSAACTVPYEGEEDGSTITPEVEVTAADQQRKNDALKPVSKSGKLYNSFRGYGKLFKPAPPKKKNEKALLPASEEEEEKKDEVEEDSTTEPPADNNHQSRIIGGGMDAGQDISAMDMEDDDGEGWITCTKDIRQLQTTGSLALPKDHATRKNDEQQGLPPQNQRTACATTDFAMQNVLLQMNLRLLSVDGIKVARLKHWVTRCGACFKVYTNADANNAPHATKMKRLFCEHCGSDMLQRIAASVDGKTGRLKLHMSKKYKNNTRGTKFSLPKPGTGNRFQGDLLLREDQMLMGAWNQKIKVRSGNRTAQSMFGQDIATSVGCKARNASVDDITAGFGRRNPNATKGGRERRGKKKKSSEKACGLRRYH